ncbi:hypothetical protein [Winogradskyella marincola]|uniref:hypothetical protein n=1 Tax=Winogradskyella marincola TaxID=3037795 RepID=UPI002413DF76|nr:hypothetical protein [Winogradskyella sp. YYF002]
MYYPSGKISWNSCDIDCASITLYKTTKTVKSNFNKLKELQWLIYDEDYQFYRLSSLDKIRKHYNWVSRKAFPFTAKDIFHIRATLGAIIYTQPYKTYCRKYFKRGSNVLKSRSADKSTAFSCDIKKYAEVSVLSIRNFFGITINKAVRLKQAAEEQGLIEVKKQYFKLQKNQVYAAKKGNQYRDESQNIVFLNEDYYIQQIDKIYTELYFKRRKKIETL